MRNKDVIKIKDLVTKSFYRLGVDNKPERLMLLVEDVIKRKIAPDVLETVLDRHAEISNFLPTLADILKIKREQLEKATYYGQPTVKQLDQLDKPKTSREDFEAFFATAKSIVEKAGSTRIG